MVALSPESWLLLRCIMSTDSYMLPPIDPRAYDPVRAEHLALRYASGEPGTSLTELYRADSEAYPPPLVVKRWRSVWPAFDALMREAEAARAVALMDDTLGIADNPATPAANAKNAIAVRWRMAEALAPDVFAPRRTLQGDASNPLRIGQAADVTDAELLRIAQGGDPALILAHEREGTPGTPHHAPAQGDGGLTRGDEGGRVPHTQLAPKTRPGGSPDSPQKILSPGKLSGVENGGVARDGFEEGLS